MELSRQQSWLNETANALRTQSAPDDRLCQITVEAPVVPLTRFPNIDYLWDPPQGPSMVASGMAQSLNAQGKDRFESIVDSAHSIWPKIVVRQEPGALTLAPRFLGGFSFFSNDQSKHWQSFGDAAFWMPRLTYTRFNNRASLAIIAPIQHRDEAIDELITTLSLLRRVPPDSKLGAPKLVHRLEQQEDEWVTRITAIKKAIDLSEIQKMVAARRCDIELSHNIDLASVLDRLEERNPDCFRFAFASNPSIFVGASPEQLICKSGHHLQTQALAGTISTHLDQHEKQLLESDKDRKEQSFVVDAITSALKSRCDWIDVPSVPSFRRLKDIVHLVTEIKATLKSDTHILELVNALHPTPAVGGVPTEKVQPWIDSSEPEGRGWYASPIGWFDASGDGEFCVALRSALIREQHAHIYAGAGIVEDSQPKAEYAETRLKQSALLDALEVPF